MKPIMWAALAASLAATAYVATQGSEEVEVVSKGGRGDSRGDTNGAPDQAGGKPARGASTSPAARTDTAPRPTGKAAEVALRARQAEQLMASVAQLQTEALRRAEAQAKPAKRGVFQVNMAAGKAVASPWGSQLPPPPPPPPPTPPPPPFVPVAPPFPHAWVGRYVDTAERVVIAGPSTTWVLKVGDVIDGQWRIDTIQDRQLNVTYLPLNQSRSVAMK
jgi:hypothetical protein